MCKDAALTYLNELGYNVIRYPRADILPLDILGRQCGTIARLGHLPDLALPGGSAPPTVRKDIHAANLEAQRSSKLNAEAAVTVISPYLQALGGNPEAGAYFRRIKSLQFVFTDVLVDEATPAEIGSFLGRCQIDHRNSLFNPYLAGDGELFIVTETLKSRKLTVAAELSNQGGVALDTGALQAAVGAKVGVSGGNQQSSILRFDGTEPLVFGFKCLRLQVSKGVLALLCAPPSAALAFPVPSSGEGEAADPQEPLVDPVILGDGLLSMGANGQHQRADAADRVEQATGEADSMSWVAASQTTAPLPEEDSPGFAASQDDALLYVRLFNADMVARSGVLCHLRGPLSPLISGRSQTSVALDTTLCSDEQGILFLDGCPAGVYELACADQTFLVHTLRQRDLTLDSEPYRLIVAEILED